MNTPTRILVEDFTVRGNEIEIGYAFEYSDGSQDKECRTVKTEMQSLETYYALLGWGKVPFGWYWDNCGYPTQLQFINVFLLDKRNAILEIVIKQIVEEVLVQMPVFRMAS